MRLFIQLVVVIALSAGGTGLARAATTLNFFQPADSSGRVGFLALNNTGTSPANVTRGEFLDHYAAGGRARSARTSEFVPGFILTDDEKADLLAFFDSLTDKALLTDPRFSDPRKPN